MMMPSLLKRSCWRYKGRWSTYLSITICASKPAPAMAFGSGLSIIGAITIFLYLHLHILGEHTGSQKVCPPHTLILLLFLHRFFYTLLHFVPGSMIISLRSRCSGSFIL